VTETSSTGLSAVDQFIRFLLFPAAIVAIIWFLWALPAWLKRSTVKPGQPWTGEPLWVNAPAQIGGPERAALVAGTAGTAGTAADVDGRGGASAQW